ncbi:hypothetical protein [Hyphomonas sp.]|uniref:hypothetical protein n=1 Tax=Hyphomonas sp. TaxID=87 RepID=UPI0030029E40
MKVEYRVREIKRFIITRYHEIEDVGSVESKGTYDNEQTAYDVAYALCKEEHGRAGTPPDDPNFQYPMHPETSRVVDHSADLAGLARGSRVE